MDWTKVKSAIGTIAPWLAGTLGTPVAGVAVKAICDIFGLTGSSATPENVTAALAGATPDQLIALKQADLKHQEFMTQIGYDHVDKLEAIDAGDRDSARKREMSVLDWTPRILAYGITLGFFTVLGFMLLNTLPAGARDPMLLMLGALQTAWVAVVSYYFGSSRGSDRKTELMAQQAGAQQ